MKPTAPIHHHIPSGAYWEGVGIAGEENGAATMSIRPHTGTRNMIFVECFVVDEYSNVVIRIGRYMTSPQHVYINGIRRR